MLDDLNSLNQHDVLEDLRLAAEEWRQAGFGAPIEDKENDQRHISNVVVAGMGGSALAADVAACWLYGDLKLPFQVVRTYDLPKYVGKDSLVIISSYSGNTEETISCFNQAKDAGCQIAVVASGGKLIEMAITDSISRVVLPCGLQPRMALIYTLCSLVGLMTNFGVLPERSSEINMIGGWLQEEGDKWAPEVPTSDNYAKQLAKQIVGKTAAFYSSSLLSAVAYKLKICCNETGKNVAMWGEYPEFNHNEFLGWTSHPVEKPFVIFNIVSSFDHPQITKRFELTDRLLSGLRPKAITINLSGDSLLKQLLWGTLLADYVNIYLASLNGVNPMSVDLIEKLKTEL